MGRRRRAIVNPKGPQKMYVVVGLPRAVHKTAVEGIQDRLKHHIVKGIPAASTDGNLYPQKFVDSLIRSIGEFAVRRRKTDKAHPTPASITLLYVPAPDEEKLLSTFDFALMATPLASLEAYGPSGRQLRHDKEAVEAALVDAVARSSDGSQNLNEVERRISYMSDNESLLLPPKNFFVEDGNLTSVFKQFRRGQRAWTDRLEELGPTPLTRDNVPNRVKPNQTRRVFVDVRDVAFFIAHPTAFDGAKREVPDATDHVELLSILRSLYRFGGAVAPGLHHDAQRNDGKPLNGTSFDCSEKGQICTNSDYANIYPNDYVRVGSYKALK